MSNYEFERNVFATVQDLFEHLDHTHSETLSQIVTILLN